MLAQEFMRHALIAGAMIGVAGGLTSYLLVLRAQVFAGDALSHVAFTGALAAAAFGIDVRIGVILACVAIALLIGMLGDGKGDDVAVGSLFAWILGVGVLFLSLYTTAHSADNAAAKVHVLFGSIFGLGRGATINAVVICSIILIACVVLLRPLLFTSLDPHVAKIRGVHVRFVTLTFMALLGLEAAEATQAVGALLLLTLIAAPGGAARLLTANPYVGAIIGASIGLGSVIVGLAASFEAPILPPSFSITATAAIIFLAAMATSRLGSSQHRARMATATITGSASRRAQ